MAGITGTFEVEVGGGRTRLTKAEYDEKVKGQLYKPTRFVNEQAYTAAGKRVHAGVAASPGSTEAPGGAPAGSWRPAQTPTGPLCVGGRGCLPGLPSRLTSTFPPT